MEGRSRRISGEHGAESQAGQRLRDSLGAHGLTEEEALHYDNPQISMDLHFTLATEEDAPAIAALRNAVADRLAREFGKGHWGYQVSVGGVRNGFKKSRVYVLRDGAALLATLRLIAKKPSEGEAPYFTPCRRPLYLYDMAVEPSRQRAGFGRLCIEEAIRIGREWPGDAIRLDAYDAPAGAGAFYEKCGFREAGRRTYFRSPIIYYEVFL